MNKFGRRDFLFSLAPLSAALPLSISADAKSKPGYRLVLPDNENVFAAGETIALRIFSKTPYPRLRVDFKANNRLIGTAKSFPYQINWTPTQTGDYVLTAEVFVGSSNVSVSTANVKVFNLLYDALGRSGNWRYNVEQHRPSFSMTNSIVEGFYGVTTQFIGTVNTPQILRRIDALLSATTGITNTMTNIPFPTNYWFVRARLWNNGKDGFINSPRNGNLSNVEIGAPNLGSIINPLVFNSQQIKFYLTGWDGLNIPLPSAAPLVLSIQYSLQSPYDFTERVNFAFSTLTGEPMLFAGGFNNGQGQNTASISGTLAIRIWTE
jgi:hypothetical protein